MIRLPSYKKLKISLQSVILRFPLLFTISLVSVGLWWYAMDAPVFVQESVYLLLGLSNFEFCLILSIALLTRQGRLSSAAGWTLKVLALFTSVPLYFHFHPLWHNTNLLNLIVLIATGHLLVSVLPFVKSGRSSSVVFWRYNVSLGKRLLTALLYSALLYGGLALALYVTEELFDIDLSHLVYTRILAFIFAGFSSWYFLAGIPHNIEHREGHISLKSIDIFSRYILLPLVSVYLLILLTYGIKIIWEGHLPNGIVSMLVVGYAGLGLFAFLLTYPLRKRLGTRKYVQAHTAYFIMTLPLFGLLLAFLNERICSYGLTERRLYLLLIAFWFLALTAYYLIRQKSLDLRVIPASLAILCLLSLVGPQSVSAVARRSQISRFIKLEISESSDKERARIVRYLVRHHGLESLQPLVKKDLHQIEHKLIRTNDSLSQSTYALERTLIDSAYVMLGIDPSFREGINNFVFFESDDPVLSLPSYTYFTKIAGYMDVKTDSNSTLPNLVISNTGDNNSLNINFNGKDSIKIDVNSIGMNLSRRIQNGSLGRKGNNTTFSVPNQYLSMDTSSAKYEIALVLSTLSLHYKEPSDSIPALNYTGYLFLRRKDRTDHSD